MSIKSKLRYIGNSTRFSFKRDWVPGSEVSMEVIFNLLVSKCPTTKQFDSNFIKWFDDSYLSNSADFELRLIESDLIADESASDEAASDEAASDEVEPDKIEWDDSDENVVRVESSSVKVTTSLQQAKTDLRNKRKNDTKTDIKSSDFGTVSVDKVETKTNITGADLVKMQPKPGVNVMTGDDLARSSVITTNRDVKPAGFVLDELGGVKQAIPTTKDRQGRIDAEMANISGRSRVLLVNPDEDGENTSRVITGDNLSINVDSPETNKKLKSKRGRKPGKVNSNFQTTVATSVVSEILPDHIVRAESDRQAIKLIKSCRNSTTLKVAKIYLKDSGRHKLVEYVDERLSELPPGQ